MRPWDMNTDQAEGYATGLLDATRQLSRCMNRLGDILGIERHALDELCDAWTRDAEMIFGFARNALKQAAEQDGEDLADAVAKDLHDHTVPDTGGHQAAPMPTPDQSGVALRGAAPEAAAGEPAPAVVKGEGGGGNSAPAAEPAEIAPDTGPAWSPARHQLLSAIYPTTLDPEFILAAINATPGVPIATWKAVQMQAYRLKLRREDKPAPDGVPACDFADAMAHVLNGKGATFLAEEFGWAPITALPFARWVRDLQREWTA